MPSFLKRVGTKDRILTKRQKKKIEILKSENQQNYKKYWNEEHQKFHHSSPSSPATVKEIGNNENRKTSEYEVEEMRHSRDFAVDIEKLNELFKTR
jgi:hypothetical protein